MDGEFELPWNSITRDGHVYVDSSDVAALFHAMASDATDPVAADTMRRQADRVDLIAIDRVTRAVARGD